MDDALALGDAAVLRDRDDGESCGTQTHGERDATEVTIDVGASVLRQMNPLRTTTSSRALCTSGVSDDAGPNHTRGAPHCAGARPATGRGEPVERSADGRSGSGKAPNRRRSQNRSHISEVVDLPEVGDGDPLPAALIQIPPTIFFASSAA